MAVLDTMRTDIMHQAAVTIQRHARGFVVRRQVHRVIRAVIKIQVNQSSLSAAVLSQMLLLKSRLPSILQCVLCSSQQALGACNTTLRLLSL
jgi:myosin heavy subunit